VAAAGTGGAALVAIAAPHSPQNLLSGALGALQASQTITSAEPHSLQNLRPGSFALPQFEQFTSKPLLAGAEAYPVLRGPG